MTHRQPPAPVFLNILVATEGSPHSRRALAEAVDLARATTAKLTLLTVAPPLSQYVTLAGVDPARMRLELDRWAEERLREAAAAVPDDVIAHTVQRSGHAGPEIID
ncbi:MAG TPA: universal stress protein, partial [Gaiellaceae bacterium]|nr:universal stress protein [Gaiellaceae bacterium]